MSSVLFRRTPLLQVAHAGVYRIPPGTVKKDGTPDVPVRRRVRLVDQVTGRFIRETWSDAVTGAYVFNYIAPGVYTVYALDHTGEYGGTIETDIVAEQMP